MLERMARTEGIEGIRMLGSAKLVAFVGVSDLDRARRFYGDVLGLRLLSAEPFALVFDAGGTMLRVTPVPQVTAAPYTVLGWQVDDVIAVGQTLRRAGIEPEFYSGLEQDEHGVWKSPAGAKILWFKDPDGNTL